MARPYNVCSVRKVGEKNYWTVVGAAFPNKKGPGFNLVLHAVPPSIEGKINLIVLPPKPKSAEAGVNATQTT